MVPVCLAHFGMFHTAPSDQFPVCTPAKDRKWRWLLFFVFDEIKRCEAVSGCTFTETMFAWGVHGPFLFHIPRNRCPFGALFVICQLQAWRIICSRRARREQGQIILLSIKAAHNTGLSFFCFTHQLTFCIKNYWWPLKNCSLWADISSRKPMVGFLPVRFKG